ncbi:helix-turn-helix domain-containing protein [Neobacillus niacini]|uniref:helix-turn-helix domain-containing protein n=1 Tax=Neobacillus niacini TaxID=86668 RepID=UPI0020424460|nr:helix-turn-helix transcriptional regulator [Neobacillus niacini]MCM3691864.1 helix-turn-helix domain-containing protein [Neobacillus niacini]
MLGDRIRKLRKQKKLTLEALAGQGLTKGMLSLIENNKAKPSMESLAYIAEGLGVDVADLLEEVSPFELRGVLERAEKLYNEKKDKEADKYQLLLTLIEPYVRYLTQGYEAARLLDIYSRSLYEEKIPGWEGFSEQAASMYDEMNVTANRAQIAIFRSMVKFIDHDYSNALEILLSERREIESNHVYMDPMTQVDLDYTAAILHFAVGDFEAATQVMENAIAFSTKHRIFYRADDLYRIGAGQAMMFSDKEKRELYLRKLKQYGEFAEDLLSILVHDLIVAMTLNAENHEYTKALEIIDQYLENPKVEEIVESLYVIEKGKSLYGLGEYKEAILHFEKVETPSTTHHPFDLSLFYIRYSYKALCHQELGELEEALESAKMAVENFDSLPDTPFKEFAINTFEKINPVQE